MESRILDKEKSELLIKKLKKEGTLACMISQNGELDFQYFANSKVATTLNPIHSCTKSIVSMLFGICMGKGLITDIHTPISEYFSDYSYVFEGSSKQQITLYNLLTMTPGLDWHEFGEWNFGTPMEYSKDIVGFILEREMDQKPGTQMNYSSGCSNLLGAVIQKVTGMKLSEFAVRQIFDPLGIDDFIWYEKQGICKGANGLRMKPVDMLKLGKLYLNNGRYEGVQLIPEKWVTESVKPRFLTYKEIGHYGYHWWMSGDTDSGKHFYYFAMGLFGQFIIVVPEYRTVTVFVSKNYKETMNTMQIFRNDILPYLSEK